MSHHVQYVHNTLKNIRLNSQISFTFDEPSNGFIELSFDTGQDFPGWSIREHQTPTKVKLLLSFKLIIILALGQSENY